MDARAGARGGRRQAPAAASGGATPKARRSDDDAATKTPPSTAGSNDPSAIAFSAGAPGSSSPFHVVQQGAGAGGCLRFMWRYGVRPWMRPGSSSERSSLLRASMVALHGGRVLSPASARERAVALISSADGRLQHLNALAQASVSVRALGDAASAARAGRAPPACPRPPQFSVCSVVSLQAVPPPPPSVLFRALYFQRASIWSAGARPFRLRRSVASPTTDCDERRVCFDSY